MLKYSNPLYKDFKFFEIIKLIQNWTWREMSVGLEIEIIKNNDVIEYSKVILQDGIQNFDLILEIAISDALDDINHKVRKLVNLEDDEDIERIMDKWCFAMLLQLYFNRNKYSNIYEQISEIGADFNHPKDMDGFIYYMPADGISLDISWLNYLKEQCDRFDIDCLL